MILHYTFIAESDSERILIIGQHLSKLWAIKYRVVFYETRCVCDCVCICIYITLLHTKKNILIKGVPRNISKTARQTVIAWLKYQTPISVSVGQCRLVMVLKNQTA